MRAGGVAVYENEEATPALQSTDRELLKYDTENMQVKRMPTAHDGVGDICSAETTINGQRALLLSVYITPGTPMCEVKKFFMRNLLICSHKLVGIIEVLDEVLLDTIPMVLGGDLNIDLKSTEGTEFLEFMRDTWKLELISDPAISTMRGDICTHTDTCDMYTSSLRHIHDPVLSSQDGNYTSIFFYKWGDPQRICVQRKNREE